MIAMPDGITIRPEIPADYAAIHTLTQKAFDPMPFSDGSEPSCITQMRKDNDLILSLVAEDDGTIVGHVAFSPAKIGDTAGWIALGPVSVAPEHQRSGIGRALITAGFDQFRHTAKGCVLTGDPAYYQRFGFVGDCGLTYRDLEPKFVQILCFGDDRPEGEVLFCPGLEAAA